MYSILGGNIYELADDGEILPDVVTHNVPFTSNTHKPTPNQHAAPTQVEPDDDGELDYGNSYTIAR